MMSITFWKIHLRKTVLLFLCPEHIWECGWVSYYDHSLLVYLGISLVTTLSVFHGSPQFYMTTCRLRVASVSTPLHTLPSRITGIFLWEWFKLPRIVKITHCWTYSRTTESESMGWWFRFKTSSLWHSSLIPKSGKHGCLSVLTHYNPVDIKSKRI